MGMETDSRTGFTTQKKMLPPDPGSFQDREDLIKYVRDFGAHQGYVVTIKKSRKDRRVILGCDRGGVYRNRRKIDESKRKRKASSRLINCPFEAIGRKEVDLWVLTIKNGDHNHEALKDMSEHPCSRRFTEEEVKEIKLMTEAGIKPRQVLKALKQRNPELQSTPRHLYNLKAKIRQGNLSERSFQSWRLNRSVQVNATSISTEIAVKQNHQPVKVPNFIGGKFLDSHSFSMIDVVNPATQEVVSQVPLTTYEEFKAAVKAAKQAFPSWKTTPITSRQRIMFKLHELIRRDIDKLSMNIAMEQGKTLKGAQKDVLRGLEVVEHACGMATLQMGEFIPNASNGIDIYCIREPLGVCAGICPFNFPTTIPLWIFPIAITCGNTFVLKPYEKNPGSSLILAELAIEAGLPDGVLNIVHGTQDIVDYICDDDDIKAISLVGSNTAGLHIYAKAAARGKRVQSNIGGKNLAIIMPDASMDACLSALVAAGFGAEGQISMTLTTIIFVGDSLPWEKELVEHAKALKVNVGTDPNADIGPVYTKEVKDRICRLVQSGIECGARLLLDGRNVMVPGYENGNFLGPTILSGVTTNMECYKEEIFGPVLLCMQAESLEEAISIVNRNNGRRGASIFTTSGITARKFQNEVEAGVVGINVSVPSPCSSFDGSKAFFTGDLNFSGRACLEFYTQVKTIAEQWKYSASLGVLLDVPSSSKPNMRSLGVSSAFQSTSDRNSQNQNTSSTMLSESEREASSGALLSIRPVSETDFTHSGASSVSPTANRDLSGWASHLVLPLSPQWTKTTPPSSERIDVLASKTNNVIKSHASQTTDAAMALAAKDVYVPSSDDNPGPVIHRNNRLAPSRRINDVHPTSERLYMPSTSHLNENMGVAPRTTDISLFSSSERLYMPSTSHLSSQRTGDRIYIPGSSQQADSMTRTSQKNDNVAPATRRVYNATSTSEGFYISSIIQRNTGLPPTSEWLCIPTPATSQRMYSQGSIVSMDEFPSQGNP